MIIKSMMLLRNTFKVALGLCLVATASSAQQSLQVNELDFSSVRKNGPTITKVEQLNIQHVSKELKALPKAQVFKNRSFVSFDKAEATTSPVTRAGGAFEAGYSFSSGVYNLVPGLGTGVDGEYTGHGILAPIDCDMKYTNTSTGALNFEWMLNDTTYVQNEESVIVRYMPFASETFEKMPTLFAYSATGLEDSYQYGQYKDPDTGEEVYGVINDQSTAFVWNCDPHVQTLTNTFYAAFTEGWSQLAFGSDSEYKASYIEFYEKPLSPILLSSTVFYVVAQPSANLTNKEFTVNWMTVSEVDGQPMWTPLVEYVTKTPSLVQRFDEAGFSIWQVAVNTPEQVLVDEQFAIIIDGPQDGTTGWALLHQVDRTSDKNTCGYIPTVGDYAGRILTYTVSTDGSTYHTYNTSLDIYLGVTIPFTIMDNGYYYVDQDTLGVPNEGMNETLNVVNWASLYFDEHDMKVESTDKSWLIATTTSKATTETMTYKVNIQAAPLPEGVAGRMADLVFTDSRGYVRTRTFVQGDYEAAGIESVSTGKLTATISGEDLVLAYPQGYTQATVLTTSGQVVASVALSADGGQTISVAGLPKGIYLVKFDGVEPQTLKVVK